RRPPAPPVHGHRIGSVLLAGPRARAALRLVEEQDGPGREPWCRVPGSGARRGSACHRTRSVRKILETEEEYEFDLGKFIKATARRKASGVMDPEDLEQDLWVFYLEELAGSGYPDGTVVDLI